MTDTAGPRPRVDPPLRAGEAETLRAFLDHHRDTLRSKVTGLDREQLGRTLAPSTMTLGGLVKHLTLPRHNGHADLLRESVDGEVGQ